MKAEIVNGCLVLTLPLGTPAPRRVRQNAGGRVVARQQADDGAGGRQADRRRRERLHPPLTNSGTDARP